MKRSMITLCCLLGITSSHAQTRVTIGVGTKVLMAATLNMPYGYFVNDGTYVDSSGTFIANGVTFDGSGNTTVNNLSFNSGSSVNNSIVSVYNTATIESSATVDANNNLYIRSDLKGGANLINDGKLVNCIKGIAVNASVVTGVDSPYASDLSLNISGAEMHYQWQSSADDLTWNNISGATNAAYTALVTGNVYYRADLTTANTSYHQSTPAIELTLNAGAGKAGNALTITDDLRIFPNPAKTEFTLKGSIGIKKDIEARLDVINTFGQVVYSSRTIARAGNLDEHIRLGSEFANGMYLLNLRSEVFSKVFHFVVEQ